MYNGRNGIEHKCHAELGIRSTEIGRLRIDEFVALVLELGKRLDSLLNGDVRVDAGRLEEVDLLGPPERGHASVHAAAQVLGAASAHIVSEDGPPLESDDTVRAVGYECVRLHSTLQSS